MKRTAALTLFSLLLAVSAWAQQPARATAPLFTTVTIDNTAGGVSIPRAAYLGMGGCQLRNEQGQIRYRLDSGAPTTTVGTLMEIGDVLTLRDIMDVFSFRAIRTGGTSGILSVSCWLPSTPAPELAPNATVSLSGVTLEGADGATLDGANATIRGTVFDYTNSNPTAVVLVAPTTGTAYEATGGGGGGGGAAQADNSALGDITGMGALYDDTPPSVTDGFVGIPRMDSDRVLFFKPFTGVTFTVGDGSGSLTVDNAGTFAVQATQAGTWNIGSITTLPALPSGANTIGSIATITTSITPGTAAGHLGKAEDAPHANGDTGVAMFGVRQDSLTPLAADGDYIPFSMTQTGRLRTDIGTSGNTASSVPSQATQIGFSDGTNLYPGRAVNLDSDGGTAMAQGVALLVPTDAGGVVGGTTNNPIIVESQSTDIELLNGVPLSASNPFPIRFSDGSQFINPAVDATHDDPVSADGPQVMLSAVDHGSAPSQVAAGDSVRWLSNRAGVPYVIGGHPNLITSTALVTDANGTQTGTLLASVGAGFKVVVTRASIKCSSANTGTVDFRLLFDTDTTAPAASTTGVTGEIVAWDDLAAGGGFAEGAGAGMLGVGGDGEDLRYHLSDPVGGSCNISVSYYIVAS